MGSAGNWVVMCITCNLRWQRRGPITEYERQAIESQPCPGCVAYTLTCREVVPAIRGRGLRSAGTPRRAA